ncbi:MAG: hypothetical protein HY069_01195 [Chlamydiia bacterium]|nr:hypothetical protein [Chlamydiia bacterium]
MRKWLFFVLLCGCAGHQMMTMQSFADVPIGASESEIVSTSGQPDTIRKMKDGTVEYEYVERIKAADRDIETRFYIFVLKDNKVTAKKIRQASPSPATFDSFEMQTTKRE